METAGKQVDDEDCELMKENGIGRPSTRANIIETLFKRQYIVRNKKQVLPATGIQLIGTIQNDLVKSGINGILGKAVKDIEKELLPLQRLSTNEW
jgi:DNA topoisomerase-3